MNGKKKRKAAAREAKAARRAGTARMTTEPFPPSPTADPAESTAAITPVTSDMMDHAAREAAERADAVAHEPADGAPEQHDAPSESETAVAEPVTMTEPDTTKAPIEVATADPVIPRPADLAFTRDRASTQGPIDRAVTSTAGSIESFGLFGAKVMEIAAANMSAAGEFVSALMAAQSVPEAAAINADHMRRQLDALTMQGRDLMLLAQKATLDALRASGDGSGEA